MAKERLLIVTERFYPEEFLINDLVKELQKKYDIEVLTQIPSYPFDKVFEGYQNRLFTLESYDGIPVHRVFTKLGYTDSIIKKIEGYLLFSLLTYFKALTLAKSFDKIFFYHTGPATMAHSSFVFHRLFKKKSYIWTQDIWPDAVFASGIKETPLRRKILEYYLKKLYKNFDKILVSCPGFIEIINKYCEKETIYVSQWYSGQDFEVKANEQNNIIEFTFLGNIGSVQNLENVCYGFLKAIDCGLNAKLNIVGDGVFFDSIKKIVDATKTNKIILWGRKPSTEMPNFIEKANILVISLKSDPVFNLYIPNKFQSYLIGNRPIFGIIKGEVAKVITENKLGFVSDPSDINDIAEGFLYFSNNINLWDQMGNNSKKYYEQNFRRETCINKILTEIED